MIYINGNWEFANDFNDISKIIREYYNEELADKLDELVKDYESLSMSEDEKEKLYEMQYIIEQIRDLVW